MGGAGIGGGGGGVKLLFAGLIGVALLSIVSSMPPIIPGLLE
jgi:hypothetical protein